jgi:hypothetical protein
MKIEACINCGSRNIRYGDISDGVLPGYTDALATYVCNDCNHQGIPIVFNSEIEYKKFLKALKEDKGLVED